jgi:hypothetical protein
MTRKQLRMIAENDDLFDELQKLRGELKNFESKTIYEQKTSKQECNNICDNIILNTK